MTIRKLFFSFIVLIVAHTYQTYAATTGTIDPSSLGNFKVTILNAGLGADAVINFGKFTTQSAYNITVTSTELRGYAWGEGVGWIVLNCADTTSGCSGANGNFKVANTTDGALSGYAWGENTGWINFGPFTNPAISTVKINTTTGFFRGSLGATGYAWSQNYGWLQFDCALAESCVETDWRPLTVLNNVGGGGVILPRPIPQNPPVPLTPPLPPNPPVVDEEDQNQNPDPDIDDNAIDSIFPPNPDDRIPENIEEVTEKNQPPVDNKRNNSPIFPNPFISRNVTDFERILGSIRGLLSGETFDYIETNQNGRRDLMEILESVVMVALGSSIVIPSLLLKKFGFTDIPFLVFRTWNAVLVFFRIRKKVRPWGTVYDSQTKQPLDPVYVTLLDLEGNEVASAITDIDGRFGFVVDSGVYTILVKKSNYSFPSTKLEGKTEDELYTNLYFGEQVRVLEDGGVLYKNIPLDQIAFDWNEYAKKNQKRLSYFNNRDIAIVRFSQFLFTLGFVFSTYSFFVGQSTTSTIVILSYIAVYFIRKLNPNYRVKGNVYVGNVPAVFSIIRFFSTTTGQEIAHKVTTRSGQYYGILPNGTYKVVIDVKNNDGTYTKKESPFLAEVTKGFYKKTIRV